jgi:hypothetical protein
MPVSMSGFSDVRFGRVEEEVGIPQLIAIEDVVSTCPTSDERRTARELARGCVSFRCNSMQALSNR